MKYCSVLKNEMIKSMSCLNFISRSIALIIFLSHLATLSYAQFVPGKEIQMLALQYDKVYFPEFLNTIKDLNTKNKKLLNTYYSRPKDKKKHKKIASFEKINNNIDPVF